MTNLEKFNSLKESAEQKGLTLSFAGYTQSNRGNETLYKVQSLDLLLIKARLPKIKKFLANIK
ncbi:MAG: hypothetical protein HN597_20505 [Desulfobacula sp.]|uniref:hypothetical protein n=1 Tax=Desulfobacula sp. TaxID=2593537 RepID=UPI0039B9264B|nr:hypothetical protein [Desulfobacula sp.]